MSGRNDAWELEDGTTVEWTNWDSDPQFNEAIYSLNDLYVRKKV